MSDNDSNRSEEILVPKIFDLVKILGASLAGITAIFTATGFLAERARLMMLGLPSTTFDLEQYVETGARFLALLPVLLRYALVYSIDPSEQSGQTRMIGTNADGNGNIIIWIVATLFLMISIIVLWTRRKPIHQWWMHKVYRPVRKWKVYKRLKTELHSVKKAWRSTIVFLDRHLLIVLIPLAVFQFDGVSQSTKALDIRDMLFAPDPFPTAISCRKLSEQVPKAEIMKCWVRRGDLAMRYRHFGWVFLITLAAGLGLYFAWRSLLSRTARLGEKAWAVVSGLLLLSQVTLLPINFGILLTGTQFSEVCVRLGATEEAPAEEQALDPPEEQALEEIPAEPLPNERLALVHQTNEGFYLYSRTQHSMWYVLRSEVRSIVHHGLVDVLGRSAAQSCQLE